MLCGNLQDELLARALNCLDAPSLSTAEWACRRFRRIGSCSSLGFVYYLIPPSHLHRIITVATCAVLENDLWREQCLRACPELGTFNIDILIEVSTKYHVLTVQSYAWQHHICSSQQDKNKAETLLTRSEWILPGASTPSSNARAPEEPLLPIKRSASVISLLQASLRADSPGLQALPAGKRTVCLFHRCANSEVP